jgi:hypothetical protein
MIPETFILQINGFISMMADYNIQGIEKTNLLLTCYKNANAKTTDAKHAKHDKHEKNNISVKTNKILHCNNFLDEDNIETILVPRYNQWIKIYQFE